MAITVDYSSATFRIIIPQADLTLVSGNLYELDTDALWSDIKALEASETGIIFQDMQSHNPAYTVAGITYTQKIEILNATNSSNTHVYEIFFSPDTQYSVRLSGSNNNIFDLQNSILANTVTQIIPTNSAGLQIVTSGSGLDFDQDTKLTRIFELLDNIEGTLDHKDVMRLMFSVIALNATGAETSITEFLDLLGIKARVTSTTDIYGNRTVVLDST